MRDRGRAPSYSWSLVLPGSVSLSLPLSSALPLESGPFASHRRADSPASLPPHFMPTLFSFLTIAVLDLYPSASPDSPSSASCFTSGQPCV